MFGGHRIMTMGKHSYAMLVIPLIKHLLSCTVFNNNILCSLFRSGWWWKESHCGTSQIWRWAFHLYRHVGGGGSCVICLCVYMCYCSVRLFVYIRLTDCVCVCVYLIDCCSVCERERDCVCVGERERETVCLCNRERACIIYALWLSERNIS